MAWIPVGFAHGFLVLSDHAELLYKATRLLGARARAHDHLGRSRPRDRVAGLRPPDASEKDRRGVRSVMPRSSSDGPALPPPGAYETTTWATDGDSPMTQGRWHGASQNGGMR